MSGVFSAVKPLARCTGGRQEGLGVVDEMHTKAQARLAQIFVCRPNGVVNVLASESRQDGAHVDAGSWKNSPALLQKPLPLSR